MKQLTNFIPKTPAECRELLIALQNNPEGVEISDRYGNMEKLDTEEIKSLCGLIEAQIGKPAEAPAAETSKEAPEEKTGEPKRDSRTPATRPASPKKTAK